MRMRTTSIRVRCGNVHNFPLPRKVELVPLMYVEERCGHMRDIHAEGVVIGLGQLEFVDRVLDLGALLTLETSVHEVF